MPTVPRKDPYKNFRFLVEIDGLTPVGFSEVILPDAFLEVIEYREGADASTSTRKLPGRVAYHPLILKKGLTAERELYDWWIATIEGNVHRRNLSIALLDDARNVVKRWNVFSAWPARYQVSSLNAEGNDVCVETLELAHEGIRLE